MIRTIRKSVLALRFSVLIALLAGGHTWAQSQPNPIRVEVDETQAPQKILHAHLQIPVHTGPVVLYYPQWIPGDHQPSGPIVNLAGLKFTASGKTVRWRRDLIDVFALHLDVPRDSTSLDVDLDFLLSAQNNAAFAVASGTAFLNVLNWYQVVLYPKGYDAATLAFVPTLRIPAGWKFNTALSVAKQNDNTIEFSPVSLETLIDSPVISGQYFRTIDLTPGQTPDHEIDMAADGEAALRMTAETQSHYSQLIAEAGALFGSRHYRDYHFLVTLSDNIAHDGEEHHESSDDRLMEHSFIDEAMRTTFAGLLPHEFVHSWNGKYRRPADLLSPDYHQPMKDDLLWVYEGLTEYLSEVLVARSGLRNEQQEREELARVSAMLDTEAGRRWRPLQDTADAAVFLYNAGDDWQNWRRGTDFYEEGIFLWLDVDDMIRRLTQGRRSLDNFCHLFYGGPGGRPEVKPYEFQDVVKALGEVAPYDWAEFLRVRLDSIEPNTPDEALNNSGWKLVYNSEPNEALDDDDSAWKQTDLSSSMGFTLADEGNVVDVVYGGASYDAGIKPGMKIVAIGGRLFSVEAMKDAIRDAQTVTSPVQLIAQDGAAVQTYAVNYHGGFRYPHLIRNDNPDLLRDILKSLVH